MEIPGQGIEPGTIEFISIGHPSKYCIGSTLLTGVTVSETLNKKIEYGVALEQDPLWKSILRFSGSALSQRSGWKSLGGCT